MELRQRILSLISTLNVLQLVCSHFQFRTIKTIGEPSKILCTWFVSSNPRNVDIGNKEDHFNIMKILCAFGQQCYLGQTITIDELNKHTNHWMTSRAKRPARVCFTIKCFFDWLIVFFLILKVKCPLILKNSNRLNFSINRLKLHFLGVNCPIYANQIDFNASLKNDARSHFATQKGKFQNKIWV